QPARAGVKEYSTLVVSDTANSKSRKDLVRVTYLGTNGYQFEYNGHAILVDPYFSRISFERMTLGWPVRPDLQRIHEGIKRLNPNVDAILVTHGHVDHLLDVPAIMRGTQS